MRRPRRDYRPSRRRARVSRRSNAAAREIARRRVASSRRVARASRRACDARADVRASTGGGRRSFRAIATAASWSLILKRSKTPCRMSEHRFYV